MHLVFYLRGLQQQVELWKIMAQSQFFKWKRTRVETGKEEIILIQGALRPSVLGTWEYIFPEEALLDVLSIMGVGNGVGKLDKLRLSVLRKLCGVKKVPDKDIMKAREIPNSILLTDSERGLSHLMLTGVTCHLIGYKKDRRGEMDDPERGGVFHQELL